MNVKYNASVTLNCISLFAKAKQSEHTTCTLIARTLLEISISIILHVAIIIYNLATVIIIIMKKILYSIDVS